MKPWRKPEYPTCTECRGTGYAKRAQWLGGMLDIVCYGCYGRGVILPFSKIVQMAAARKARQGSARL